ncbi:hypothetical protein BRADI_1g00413v3 [Brachypodium distachyon]|uniref:Uncharacterized protein n=1 Tax=Brachypodium distachyon TaxID=15368 RepID=A0A0Q3RFB0_BRADI|nr:hypothetical protein BRADI_1g00413v3 [Brachypodium distachyon]
MGGGGGGLPIVKDWLQLVDFDPDSWSDFDDVEHWWTTIAFAHESQRKSIASLLMLVTWVLWKERNTGTFNNVSTMPTIIFDKIKLESRTWVLAGAKHLCTLILGG